MKVRSNYSHTFYGIFWFDLPLAIILCFIFHIIVRNQLFNNLPTVIRSRILIYNQFNWKNYFKQHYFVILSSILIGVASHLLWDSFTHDHGYFVTHIYELRDSISIFNKQIPVLKVAQHLSTFLGAIAIIIGMLKLPKNDISGTSINKNYWIIIIIIIFIIITIRVLFGLNYKAYGHIIVSLISAILIALITTPLFFKSKSYW